MEEINWDFDTPEHIDWPECTEYPSEPNPFHYDYELAQNEPKSTDKE